MKNSTGHSHCWSIQANLRAPKATAERLKGRWCAASSCSRACALQNRPRSTSTWTTIHVVLSLYYFCFHFFLKSLSFLESILSTSRDALQNPSHSTSLAPDPRQPRMRKCPWEPGHLGHRAGCRSSHTLHSCLGPRSCLCYPSRLAEPKHWESASVSQLEFFVSWEPIPYSRSSVTSAWSDRHAKKLRGNNLYWK